MIQANELRIDNKFLGISGGDTWREYTVNLTYLGLIYEFPEQYKPIPLTPELLSKCGFIYNDKETNWDLKITGGGIVGLDDEDYSFVLLDNYDELGFTGSIKSRIKYLHQLQNLYFALTGEELNYTP